MSVSTPRNFEAGSAQEIQPERRWPQLGSLENILYFAQLSKSLKPKSVDELYQMLSDYHVAESWAYFIAQNEVPKSGSSEGNVSLDTRDLHGYQRGPVIDAEFNYDPMHDNNFVYVHGRPTAGTKSSSYNIRMFLRNDLELDTTKPIEAFEVKGKPQNKSYRQKVFRPSAFPRYKEDRPQVFLSILRTAASGLENFVNSRDNF